MWSASRLISALELIAAQGRSFARKQSKARGKASSIMGDRLEERKDFTAEVTAKLPEAKKLAEVRWCLLRC